MSAPVAGGSVDSKTRRACDACRARKSRCDATSTTVPCSYCTSKQRPCTYTASTSKGPPLTYLSSLEMRAAATEKLLRQLSAEAGVDLVALLDSPASQEEKTKQLEQVAERLRTQEGKGKERETASAQRSPHSSIFRMAGDSPASGMDESYDSPRSGSMNAEEGEIVMDTQRFIGPSSGPHLAKQLFALTKIGNVEHKMEMGTSLVDHLLQTTHSWHAARVPLPPADLTAALLNAYFANINSQICLIHRPSFERAIKAGMLESDSSFRRLVFSMLALGSRFVEDPRLEKIGEGDATQHSRGFAFFGQVVPPQSLFVSSLFDIQTSALAVMWLLAACDYMTAWQAVGIMCRAALDVGAHRERIQRWSSSPLEDQLRKRAFHLLITIDRSISSSLDRPVTIAEEDISLVLPLNISDEALDEWNVRGHRFEPPPAPTEPTALLGMISLMKLQQIQGKILRRLYGPRKHTMDGQSLPELIRTIAELDGMLNHWLAEVPDWLRWRKNMDRRWMAQSAMLLGTYYNAQILIHRQFIAPARSSLLSLPSLSICTNASRSAAHLLAAVRENNLLESAYFWAPFISGTSGIMLLLTLFSQGPDGPGFTSSALSDLETCLEVTGELGKTTNMAKLFAAAMGGLLEVVKGSLAKRGRTLKSTGTTQNSPAADSPSKGSSTSSSDMILPITTDELRKDQWNGMPTFAAATYRPTPNPALNPLAAGAPSPGPFAPGAPGSEAIDPMDYNALFNSDATSAAWPNFDTTTQGGLAGVPLTNDAQDWTLNWADVGLNQDWTEVGQNFWEMNQQT